MVEVTIRPGPTAEPWNVVSTTPVASEGDPWAVKATEPVQPPGLSSWIVKAIEPITSYPATQGRIAKEGFEQAGQGLSDLRPQALGGPEGGTGGAIWDTLAGSLKYATSPIEAGLETVVGKPLEENFGIPKEYPMFAAGLAIPYYGLRGSGLQTGAKKIFTPESLGPEAEKAAGSIRREQGIAARDTTTTATEIEKFYPAINALPDVERLDLIKYMEGRSVGAPLTNPQLQPIADTLRTAFEQRRSKIAVMPSHAQMNFVEDYFPHFWKDPNAAANFARSFGGTPKQGSGASMKARTMPTIEDGIAAGLEPITTNPLEATMRYVTSMDKFIAQQRVLQQHIDDGTIIYVRPKAMGASGHPESVKVPAGYVPLEGRGAVNAVGAKAYAPENFARVYNNFISRGFEGIGSGEYGSAYQAARKANNAVTALELSLSGYHMWTMANEAVMHNLARAIRQGGVDRVSTGRAFMTAAAAPFAPVTLARKGGEVERVAMGVQPGSPEMNQIVDILTEAGARFKGRSHAHDIGNSAMGSFWTAWRRGSLKTEVLSDISDIKTAKVAGQAGIIAKNIGRALDTTMQPIFEVYIPKLKNGAAYESMADWIKANPAASREEAVAAARKIVDSVDNRFGEMIQDNLFWNKFAKQSAMLSLRSFSWTMGAIREIAGGVTDTLAGHGLIKGMSPTQRQAYIIALPIVYAMQSALFQGIKTGELPQDMHDLMYPRTGGVDATTGEPERVVPPGFMKDVFGWTQHPGTEIKNKMGTAPRLAYEVSPMGGKDWRGDPIAPPGEEGASLPANAPTWLRAYFSHILEALGPISLKNAVKGPKEGSNLSRTELLLGLQPAGMAKTSPEGFEVMMRRKEMREWRRKIMHDENEKAKYPEYKGP